MKKIVKLLILTILFVGCTLSEKKKSNDDNYKIVVNCEKSEPEVYVIIIGKTLYIFKEQDINTAISQSKVNPDNIKTMYIFKEGAAEQLPKISALLPEFEGRISSITEIVMKDDIQQQGR